MLYGLHRCLTELDYYITGPWFAIVLLATGLFFSGYLRFPQIRYFGKSIRILLNKENVTTQGSGSISPFQALSTSLGGSIGTGNITGVALAIHLGGPASLFWMLVTAFLGMTTKFMEVTLCHRYREQTAQGVPVGGPMYYMRGRLKMPWLGGLFALAILFTASAAGNLPQVNSIAQSMAFSFGLSTPITGIGVSLLLAFVIIGGTQRIARWAEWLIPFMSLLYIAGAVTVLAYYHAQLLPTLASIFSDVWRGTAATGGFLGASVAFSFRQGVNRGLFSNDAGTGISGITHASSQLKDSVTEGILSLLEPFFSTVVICMLTGLTILVSGAWKDKVTHTLVTADVLVLADRYDTEKAVQQLADYVEGRIRLPTFQGDLVVQEGVIQQAAITCLHARSVVEAIQVSCQGKPFTGHIAVHQGRIVSRHAITLVGKSLLPGTDMASYAFTTGWLGNWGHYIVTISLFFFAFTTIMAWYYYSDECLGYLGASRYIPLYKLFFVVVTFLGAIIDASAVWNLANTIYALIAVVNLIGLWLMYKDIKAIVTDYEKKSL